MGREETGDSFAEPAPAATIIFRFAAVCSAAAKINGFNRTGVAECTNLSWGG